MKTSGFLSILGVVTWFAVFPLAAWAATYEIVSQNTLHLGWGKPAYQTTKNAFFKNTVVPAYDVVILQEVMDSTIDAQINPGTYTWYVSGAKGKGSYKERYGFLVKPGMTVNTGLVDYTDAAGDFMRPPSGLMVKSSTGTNWTWLINYHAVFGSSKSVRALEVSKMDQVYNAFVATGLGAPAVTTNRVVVAGDWNLPGGDAAFANLKFAAGGASAEVKPDVETSLKRNGDLSQAYDHFVWDSGKVTLASERVVYTPGGGLDCTNFPPAAGTNCGPFRAAISDHLGIAATVND